MSQEGTLISPDWWRNASASLTESIRFAGLIAKLSLMHFCAYHQVEHPEADFNATQLKRKKSGWCRSALAEAKRLKENGLAIQSKAEGKGGRPRWDSEEDRLKIEQWILDGKSYSWIGRQFLNAKGNHRQASEILKLAREHGWESQQAKDLRDPPAPKTKVCSRCGEEKLIQEFPIRSDRKVPDAHCSRCDKKLARERNRVSYLANAEARREDSRRYREQNPEKHREAVRRRSVRSGRKHRRERYNRQALRDRDKGLCYFCGEAIDPSIPYYTYDEQGRRTGTNAMAEVVHHHLPYSKYGPDCLSNVALAHQKCNGHHYDAYECPLNDPAWTVRQISSQVARQVALDRHYLRRKQSVSYAYGAFYEDELMAMVSFGIPGSRRTVDSVCDEPSLVIELNRLWIADQAPPHMASWFLARALRLLPPHIVISYADTAISDPRNGRNHNGSVYRAMSFNYAGRTTEQTDWVLPGTTRNVGKKTEGSIPIKVSSKERYWTVTGSKRERRKLLQSSKWPMMAYESGNKEGPA